MKEVTEWTFQDVEPHTNVALALAFAIFANYNPNGPMDIVAEHDCIWAGPDVLLTKKDDKEKLKALGWRVDYSIDRWFLRV